MIWSPVGTPNQVCIMQTAGWVEPADIDMWTVTIIHLSIAPYPLVGFMDKVNLTNFHLDKWSPRHCPTRASLFTDKCILTCVTRTNISWQVSPGQMYPEHALVHQQSYLLVEATSPLSTASRNFFSSKDRTPEPMELVGLPFLPSDPATPVFLKKRLFFR